MAKSENSNFGAREELRFDTVSSFVIREALASDILPSAEHSFMTATGATLKNAKRSRGRRSSVPALSVSEDGPEHTPEANVGHRSRRSSLPHGGGSEASFESHSPKHRSRRSSVPNAGGSEASCESHSPKQRGRRSSLPTGDAFESTSVSISACSPSITKSSSDVPRWKEDYSHAMADMEVVTIKARHGIVQTEVVVRMLCHSQGVVRDDLSWAERIAMRRVMVVIGDVGRSATPWMSLVQPGAHFHLKGFNVLFFDVPGWQGDTARFMKHGTQLLLGLLRYLKVSKVSTLARGIGGAMFVKALTWAPELFGKTHLVYNMDFPEDKGNRFPGATLHSTLSAACIQIWFAYCDDDVCDRASPGSAQNAYQVLESAQQQLQQGRLVRMKQRLSSSDKLFDEIIFTENLNLDFAINIDDLPVSATSVALLFSKRFLKSLEIFFTASPSARQDTLEEGLVPDPAGRLHHSPKTPHSPKSPKDGGWGDGELVALRRIDKHNVEFGEPFKSSLASRRKMSAIDRAMSTMQLVPDSARDASSASSSVALGGVPKSPPKSDLQKELPTVALGSVQPIEQWAFSPKSDRSPKSHDLVKEQGLPDCINLSKSPKVKPATPEIFSSRQNCSSCGALPKLTPMAKQITV